MIIDKQKLREALEYRAKINRAKFDDLDFSDYLSFQYITKEQIKEFKYAGLSNVDFITMMLEGEDD